MRLKYLLLAVVLALPGVFAPAQNLSDTDSVIRVSSNLVMVPVSVTDPNGDSVRDLRPEDFQVHEDGRQEPVAKLVEPGQTPVDLALLLDVSGSVSGKFEFERDAAARFLQKVWRPGDTLSIFSIGPEPQVVLPRTGELAAALARIRTVSSTRSSTAFFDVVVAAAKFLRSSAAPESRRVEVALSDGEDNHSSENELVAALREVQRNDCIFYAINPSGPSIRLNSVSLRGHEGMHRLAATTGGTAFLPADESELDSMFARIATELRAQYLIEYYSSDQRRNGTFRQIEVSIPSRPELRVRARQGYYPG
jgi:Ca-activated chloride channel homolog